MSALPDNWEEWPVLAQVELLRELRRSYYWARPVEWIHDYVIFPPGRGLTPYQEECLAAIPVHKRVSVRGPHGIGKTTVFALAVLWFSDTREGLDWKIITTASVWRQLKVYLWPEVHKWAGVLRWSKMQRSRWRRGTELLDMGIKLVTGQASAVASDKPEAIEGAHADFLLYLLDESKTIPANTFDAIEGAFSGAGTDTAAEAYALSMSTPGEPNGRFYEIQKRRPGFEDWWVRHVTLEEGIAAGRISREWAEQRARQWTITSAVYQNRVLGNFASADEDAVIPLTWVELSNERWLAQHDDPEWKLPPFVCVGVDVARSGPAHTIQATRFGSTIQELRDYQHNSTMETSGQVAGILRSHHDGGESGYACVDVIGVGAGVVDRLREEGFDVEAFVASGRSENLDDIGELGYANRRAEAWWTMRQLLDPSKGHDIALPADDQLTGDLTAPHYRVVSGGRILVEAKDEIEKRLGRSTDFGDAVVQAFVPRVFTEEQGIVTWEPDYSISPF